MSDEPASQENVRPRVFIIHEPLRKETDDNGVDRYVRTRDLSPAREHGELHYVYPAGRLSQEPSYLVKTARQSLATFTSQDFLLLSGDLLAISVASMIAIQCLEDNATTINVLTWDGRFRRYFPTVVEVFEEETDPLDLVS